MGNNLAFTDLGSGLTATAIASGGDHSCALLNNGTMKCWGFNGYGQLGLGDTNNRGDNANEMGANLPTVSLGQGQTISAISVGGFSTCALLGTGSVKCWGLNAEGLSGTGDTTERGDGVGEMGDELPTVFLGDRVAKTVMVNGDGAVCSLLDTNQIKCWGFNTLGQLGLGDTNNRGDNPHEMGDALPVVDVGPDAQDVQ
jgi:alpha-tubulin suppressor-like RCC1 family protein